MENINKNGSSETFKSQVSSVDNEIIIYQPDSTVKLEVRLEDDTVWLTQLSDKVDFFVRTSLPPLEGIFFNGQIFDAHVFASGLFHNPFKTIYHA